jgi:hypothetical protein
MSVERETVELITELQTLLARSRRLRLRADVMETEIQGLRRMVLEQCAIHGPESVAVAVDPRAAPRGSPASASGRAYGKRPNGSPSPPPVSPQATKPV